MALKPFRKCPQCGNYNTLDKDICVCGNRIRGLAPNMVDEALVYGGKKEEPVKTSPVKEEPVKPASVKEESVTLKPEKTTDTAERSPQTIQSEPTAKTEISGKYIQTCPVCRTEYTLDSVKDRKRQCTSCGKKRIGLIEPVLLVDDGAAAPGPQAETGSKLEETRTGIGPKPGTAPKPETGAQSGSAQKPESTQSGPAPKPESPQPGPGPKPGTNPQPDPAPKQEHPGPVTIASVPPYVGCRVSFTWQDAPILLGRSAALGDFLSQDGRVGNEHCILCIENGQWHVKDNHSRNSTLLNNRKVSSETPMKLTKGCRLTLGNRMDSMEFEVETV